MFDIVRYTHDKADEWNDFVARSKNGTFLFDRRYMDYHSDRFADHSLMFYIGRRLYALMPAHSDGSVFCSHLGLTYGGVVMTVDTTAAEVVQLFHELNTYLRQQGFMKVVYRAIPWVYSRVPSEEDLYAMFWTSQARLQRRMAGTAIDLGCHLPWRKDHLRRLRQSQAMGITVEHTDSLREFWQVLEQNLSARFQARPVHSLAEMELLKSRFPDHILQYNACLDGQVVGGITFYVMGHVLHGQYSATNDLGKQYGAMEAIYDRVICCDFPQMRYLDFGTSNEEGGKVLNEGLIAHKEGYGGRMVCYDTYEWSL